MVALTAKSSRALFLLRSDEVSTCLAYRASTSSKRPHPKKPPGGRALPVEASELAASSKVK